MQRRFGVMALFLALCTVPAIGQTPPSGSESQASWTFDTFTPGPCSPTGAGHGGCNPGERVRIAVTTIASGLVQPWHVTFLPGTNDIIVTELPGRLRIIRNGVLDSPPVPGWPTPSIPSRTLHSFVLHPHFAENRIVYLTYVKGRDAETRTPTTIAVARARDVRQAPDGTIYLAVERDTQLGPGSTRLTPTGSILRITPAH